MNDLLKVGVITSTHGLKGELKVFPMTDDSGRFSALKSVIVFTFEEKKVLPIISVKYFKNIVIIKFKGINNIDDALGYKGKELYITRAQAVKCEEGEYFITDLIGLPVISDEGEALGRLSDVLVTGANDVYVVSQEGKKDLLLPAIKECILKIDLTQKIMQVHIMTGLRE